LLPAPAAEVLRTVHLKRRYGYGVGSLVASQLVEKVIDSLGLGLETLIVAWFLPLPQHVARSLYGFSLLVCVGVLGALGIAWRHRRREARADAAHATEGRAEGTWRARVEEFLHRLGEGFALLGRARMWAWALFWSLINDAANALSVGLVLAA